jgi:Spy/CpxP family protein refolding chaperone
MTLPTNLTRRVRVLAALLGTLSLGIAAVAAHSGPRSYGHREPGAMHGLQGIVGTLGLTSDQQAAVDKIFAAHHDASKAGGREFMAATKALADQVRAETFDEAAIRQTAATVAKFEADRAVGDAEMLSEIRAQLNPEQRTQLQQALASRDEMPESMGPVVPRDRYR